MKTQFTKLLSACLVAGLLFSVNTTVLAAPSQENAVQNEATVSTINPYEKVEAENYQLIKDAGAGCNTTWKSCGVDIRRSGYIGFQNVDFETGTESISIYAVLQTSATLDIKIDSLDSESIASMDIVNSSGFVTRTFNLNTRLTGIHDLYFVVTKSSSNLAISMDYWSAEKAPVPEPTPDLTLEYEINNWGYGYNVNFNVVNKTDNDIIGWALKIKKSDCPIDHSWCVNIADDGDYYVITPLDWNSIVPANGSISFGIQGSGDIAETIEHTFIEPVAVATEELALDYDIQSWETGYNVNFTLTNKSGQQLNGWTVKLDKNTCTIDSSWSVNVEETDDYYILTPMNWNSIIGPNGNTTFGIQGSGEIGDAIEYVLE